jgi:hypothetical protein
MPPSTPSPADLTPDQRFRQLAAILVQGLVRWRNSGRASAGKNLSQFPTDGLEVVSETRLSVCVGFDPDPETMNAR